jgi:hypothetical protein
MWHRPFACRCRLNTPPVFAQCQYATGRESPRSCRLRSPLVGHAGERRRRCWLRRKPDCDRELIVVLVGFGHLILGIDAHRDDVRPAVVVGLERKRRVQTGACRAPLPHVQMTRLVCSARSCSSSPRRLRIRRLDAHRSCRTGGHGEESPLAGNALEIVDAAVGELDGRPRNEIPYRARDEHFAR